MEHKPTLRLLWAGRMLKLKRVDTVIRAVGGLSTSPAWVKIILDIYGSGPDESRLRKIAARYGDAIRFFPPVPIDEIRGVMREHDMLVLASDSNEGWGAVVSEALEEGLKVLGTHEAGASAAMLPKEDLFHAGDWRRLAELLRRCADEKFAGTLKGQGIGEWTVRRAADRLLGLDADCGKTGK